METSENTNGAVKKLTYGDRGGDMHPCPPSGYAPEFTQSLILFHEVLVLKTDHS